MTCGLIVAAVDIVARIDSFRSNDAVDCSPIAVSFEAYSAEDKDAEESAESCVALVEISESTEFVECKLAEPNEDAVADAEKDDGDSDADEMADEGKLLLDFSSLISVLEVSVSQGSSCTITSDDTTAARLRDAGSSDSRICDCNW